jgi:hypothetical protein
LNKIVLSKRTSAIFLAIVLVVGTFALTGPTFTINAQATSDREKDYDNDDYNKKSYYKYRDDKSREHDKGYDYENSYGKDDRDKSKDIKNVNIKKIKCNNINVNLNGIDADIRLPFNHGPLNGVIAEAYAAEEDDEGANSFEKSGSKSNHDKKGQSDSDRDFKFVCINNNNNIVAVGEPEPPTCEECFTKFLSEEELDDLIEAIIEDGGPDSLQGLCEFIANNLDEEGRAFISDRLFVLGEDVGISEDKINEILDCLEEVFGGDFPREILEEPLTVQQMKWKS